MGDIGTYVAENLRLSFSAWGEAQRVGSLTAAVVSLIVALLALAGVNAKVKPNTFQEIALLAGAWFFALVLVVTPYRMWLVQRHEVKARDGEIESLQSQVAAKVTAQAKIDRLWNLREDGVSIRNLRLNDPVEVPAWLRQVQEWRGHILEAAEQVSPNLRAYLEVLDQTRDPPAGVIPVSPDHARWHRVMSEILLRLGEYLAKLP